MKKAHQKAHPDYTHHGAFELLKITYVLKGTTQLLFLQLNMLVKICLLAVLRIPVDITTYVNCINEWELSFL